MKRDEMTFKSTRVLVTGAGGFIGSHLVERLVREGSRVRAMVRYNARGSWGNLEFVPKDVRNNIEVYAGDVTDSSSVRTAVQGCEMVFHLAALIGIPYSYLAPQSYVATNIMGTVNVLNAAREFSVAKVVHTSTSETYGTAIYTPVDEKHPLQGQSPYSASKIGADKIAESFYLSFGVPVATVRPFNVFGPRQSARAVIPTVISQLISGNKKIRLGSLSPIRDFTYVQDTVSGFLAVASSEKALGQVINIGSGTAVTIGETAEQIIKLIGTEASIEVDAKRVRPEGSEVMELLCNNSKAKELLGWEPRISLRDGLQRVIAFVEENIGLYKPDIYNV
jgi:NAD dependent epimerase/dehydratase